MSGDDPVRIDLPAEVEDVGVSFSTEDSIVPLTVGLKQRPPEEVRFDVAIKLHCALYKPVTTDPKEQRLPSNFQSLEQPLCVVPFIILSTCIGCFASICMVCVQLELQ